MNKKSLAQKQTGGTTDAADSIEIHDFIIGAARILDRRQFINWLDLFTTDGVYCMITSENLECNGPYNVYDDGSVALKHRVAWLLRLFQVERAKTLHQVTNIHVTGISEYEATVESNFVMYRTTDNGTPALSACGEYRDSLRKENGRWLFARRQVVLDNGIIPAGLTDLV